MSSSFDADNLETDSHCVAVKSESFLYFERWRMLKSPSCCVMMTESGEERRNNVSSRTGARCFSNRNRLMHNYTEPKCREDFITDVSRSHSKPHVQSQACILMPIRECSSHMCAIFLFLVLIGMGFFLFFFLDKVYVLFLVYLLQEGNCFSGTMFTSEYFDSQMPWAQQILLSTRIICLS